jgi:REP element-mobilizing transposase RayT
VFDAQAIDVLRDIFADVRLDTHGTLVEMEGEDDHVHLLVESDACAEPTRRAISKKLRSVLMRTHRDLCR